MDELLTYFENLELRRVIVAGITLVAGLIVVQIVKRITLTRLRRRESAFARPAKSFLFPALNVALLFGVVQTVGVPTNAARVVTVTFAIILGYLGIRLALATTDRVVSRVTSSRGISEDDQKRYKAMQAIISPVIWVIGVLILLENLGIQISTIVAGIGISGIAVALAAQAVLGDLFSYFVVLMDRPFDVGDFVIFGDIMGTVEKLGIKNSRIRSLSGEQIIVPNGDLTSSRMHNYKQMEERRVIFSIGLVYETPADALETVPGLLQDIVEGQEGVRFDRAHFKSYGDFSLNFEIVYYVLSPDYTVYMNIQQAINLAIYRAFEERGLEFAFPTRTVHLHRSKETLR
ncbi:MAG: mechanosensitive ion channel family protein [bacterium]